MSQLRRGVGSHWLPVFRLLLFRIQTSCYTSVGNYSRLPWRTGSTLFKSHVHRQSIFRIHLKVFESRAEVIGWPTSTLCHIYPCCIHDHWLVCVCVSLCVCHFQFIILELSLAPCMNFDENLIVMSVGILLCHWKPHTPALSTWDVRKFNWYVQISLCLH